jgi:hypothetical protein
MNSNRSSASRLVQAGAGLSYSVCKRIVSARTLSTVGQTGHDDRVRTSRLRQGLAVDHVFMTGASTTPAEPDLVETSAPPQKR